MEQRFKPSVHRDHRVGSVCSTSEPYIFMTYLNTTARYRLGMNYISILNRTERLPTMQVADKPVVIPAGVTYAVFMCTDCNSYRFLENLMHSFMRCQFLYLPLSSLCHYSCLTNKLHHLIFSWYLNDNKCMHYNCF